MLNLVTNQVRACAFCTLASISPETVPGSSLCGITKRNPEQSLITMRYLGCAPDLSFTLETPWPAPRSSAEGARS